MPNLAKNAAIITLGNVARLLVKTIMGFLLARLFVKSDYGTYRQLFLLYDTVSAFILLGLPQSLVYFIPKFKDEPQKLNAFIAQSINILQLLGFLAMGGFYFFRFPLATWLNNPALAELLPLFCLYPLFMFLSGGYLFFQIGFEKPREVAKYSIFSVITDALCIVGAVLIFDNLRFAVGGMVLSAFLQYLYSIVSLRKHLLPRLDTSLFKQQFFFSLPLGLSSLVGVISAQLDKLVISHYFNPALYAVFSVGAMQVPLTQTLISSVNSVLMPALSRDAQNNETIAKVYSGAVRKNALLILPLSAFFFAFAADFFCVTYSDKYLPAVPFFRVYLLMLPSKIATYSLILQAKGYTRQIFYVSLISLATNLLFNILLVFVWGMMGPVIATVITHYLAVGIYVYYLKNSFGFNLKKLFALEQSIKTLLVSVIAVLPVYGLNYIPLNSWLRLPLAFILFAGLFYLLGRLFKVITAYDLDLLRKAKGSINERFRKKRTLANL